MNPKNALFLSASLTAFVLAVLFGVVTKVTNTPTVAAAAAEAQVTATTAILPTDAPTEEILPTATTAQGPLGPEEAAALAAKALGQEDVYSVETFSFNGADSYKVVFSSGDIVYMGMDRTVLEMGKLPAVVVAAAAPTKAPKKNKGSANNNNQAPSAPPSDGGGEGGGGDDEHDD